MRFGVRRWGSRRLVRKGEQPPWVVPDGLWERIEPLLPKRPRRFRYPGRKPFDDRRGLCGKLLWRGWRFVPGGGGAAWVGPGDPRVTQTGSGRVSVPCVGVVLVWLPAPARPPCWPDQKPVRGQPRDSSQIW